MKFKVGDKVCRIGSPDVSFEIEAIEEPNPFTKAFSVLSGHPEVADDPLVMSHSEGMAFPEGLVELVSTHEVH